LREDFLKLANHKQELHMAAMDILYMLNGFREDFLEIDQPETRIANGGRTCLLRDRNEMSNLYRGTSIYASYQVLAHLAKRFQRYFLEINQSETRIAYSSHACQRVGAK
jgi:hypothetical protein